MSSATIIPQNINDPVTKYKQKNLKIEIKMINIILGKC
jgi:hypothetical protein